MQGYLVGNGVTDAVFDGNSFVPFAHGMGLISDELFEVRFLNTSVIVQEVCSCTFNRTRVGFEGPNHAPLRRQSALNAMVITTIQRARTVRTNLSKLMK